MNKKQLAVSTKKLIVDVADSFKEVSKKVTRDVILNFLHSVEDYVVLGKKVRLDKLGILHVKDRAARKGRNPQTGEAIKIPASKKVSFRVAGSLKEKVGVKKKKGVKASKPAKPAKKVTKAKTVKKAAPSKTKAKVKAKVTKKRKK